MRNEQKLLLFCGAFFPLILPGMFYSEGTWNFSEPKAVGLGKEPVMAIAVVTENLWCSCGNKLFIINHEEEAIKVCILLRVVYLRGT